MNKKILAFVYDGNRFLILRNNPKDLAHGGDFWFTVTGSLNKTDTNEDAVKREIMEETGLKTIHIFDLNWESIYCWAGEEYFEKNFLAFIKKSNVKLSKEHIEFKWLDLDNFIKTIEWGADKDELKKALSAGIKRQSFFNKTKIEDYRKK